MKGGVARLITGKAMEQSKTTTQSNDNVPNDFEFDVLIDQEDSSIRKIQIRVEGKTPPSNALVELWMRNRYAENGIRSITVLPRN